MTEIETNINRYSQNMITNTQIMNWFKQHDLPTKKEIRDTLAMFIQQSHPTDELLKDAIQTAPIKETMIPVVLFKTQTLNIALNKIKNLPDIELNKSFVIMLSIFKTADTFRRKTYCMGNCTHKWHNID